MRTFRPALRSCSDISVADARLCVDRKHSHLSELKGIKFTRNNSVIKQLLFRVSHQAWVRSHATGCIHLACSKPTRSGMGAKPSPQSYHRIKHPRVRPVQFLLGRRRIRCHQSRSAVVSSFGGASPLPLWAVKSLACVSPLAVEKMDVGVPAP